MMQTWEYLSLDPDDMQRRVGTVLRRHHLRVQNSSTAFRAHVEYLGDEKLSIARLSYGAPVIVEPVPEPGFWVLSLPLQGSVDVFADTGRVDSRPGVASLIPSSGTGSGHWQGKTRQAVLRIREDLLCDACDGIADEPDRFLRRASPVLPVGSDAGLLLGALQTLTALDFRQYMALPPQGIANQWAAAASLIANAIIGARLSGAGRKMPEASARQVRLRRARTLLQDLVYAGELLTVATLAQRMGLSVRSLQNLFQKESGSTARQAIHEAKLLRARELLQTGRDSVTNVALDCGFQHTGRFAAMYARQFGCLPSQGRRASR